MLQRRHSPQIISSLHEGTCLFVTDLSKKHIIYILLVKMKCKNDHSTQHHELYFKGMIIHKYPQYDVLSCSHRHWQVSTHLRTNRFLLVLQRLLSKSSLALEAAHNVLSCIQNGELVNWFGESSTKQTKINSRLHGHTVRLKNPSDLHSWNLER